MKKAKTPSSRAGRKAGTRAGKNASEPRQETFLAALRDALGLTSLACQRSGVSVAQYRSWLETDAEFAREVEAIEELALDFVESKAFEEIQKGNARLIQFFLQTKGRKRGYDPRGEYDKKPAVALLSADEMEY